MEDLAQLAGGVIALLSLGVSIWVAVKQSRVAREQTAIQERLAAIEEARRAEEVAARVRALVTASIEARPGRRGIDKALVLHNEGLALAREVAVEVERGPSVPQVLGLEVLPVDLQPDQRMPFHITPLALGDTPTLRLAVRWTDEDGEHRAPYTLQV